MLLKRGLSALMSNLMAILIRQDGTLFRGFESTKTEIYAVNFFTVLAAGTTSTIFRDVTAGIYTFVTAALLGNDGITDRSIIIKEIIVGFIIEQVFSIGKDEAYSSHFS